MSDANRIEQFIREAAKQAGNNKLAKLANEIAAKVAAEIEKKTGQKVKALAVTRKDMLARVRKLAGRVVELRDTDIDWQLRGELEIHPDGVHMRVKNDMAQVVFTTEDIDALLGNELDEDSPTAEWIIQISR